MYDRESVIETILRLDPSLSRIEIEGLSQDAMNMQHWAAIRKYNKMRKAQKRKEKRKATKTNQARVSLGGVRVSLGYFKTAEEAQAAIEQAKFLHSIGLPYNAR